MSRGFAAIPDGKPLRTFPGIAPPFAAIPDGKPLRTFPGIAPLFAAIPDGKPLRTFPGIAGEARHIAGDGGPPWSTADEGTLLDGL
ncbi:hypothetical protein [Mesorhizobium sp. M1D.F.Ca.ET.043.01.1.1]|uniref:hypothetical protein n=1 Tax=Mesorhizobium sp. M1D.F.Ca.ET.043.01.1.1 TaxID=2493669 RepID=UPI0016784364|nr:hypothetical protein [Mesorhizobium sp. M1D.F.Ca.ET.043.01.1.1]